ncbi:hypothetical protein IC582_011814 [Cucumis melo]|uniref:Calcineurin-like metallo-phosphoesterase superfamily protein n=2 Tax=Cucumis melo TaxID=3656 RepID=A0A5D3BFL8_CUCMM|nr:uncharacterized protein LOC103496469 [Cucumis melo]KAA0063560.1 uncharacterized protein E6C27_scaffold329G00680 [Cucumis melo var. makuwa]TYJ97886.1 uncharacterized protein E5676_scaffold285G001010 [Cucumis melo var. makuwa]
MADPSISTTVLAQVCLCFAFYLCLNMGRSKNYDLLKIRDENPLDFYFISVWGGLRSVKEETLLLKQMEKMAKVSHAKFILHIREPGENDRLMQNGTWYFSSLKVPWHSIRASRGVDGNHFIERIKLQYGQTLDIIAIDTGLLQEHVAMGSASQALNSHLLWLKRTLQASSSNWRIVVGFHPLVTCENNTRSLETKHLFDSVHRIFVENGVNAYLSRRGCSYNVRIGSIAYIGIPGPIQKTHFQSRKSSFREFLLQRVSSLETVFYYVNTEGDVVHKTELQQKGREVI